MKRSYLIYLSTPVLSDPPVRHKNLAFAKNLNLAANWAACRGKDGWLCKLKVFTTPKGLLSGSFLFSLSPEIYHAEWVYVDKRDY